MKQRITQVILSLALLTLSASSCQRSSDEVWNDTKTAGRHVSRGVQSLGGKHGDSRQVKSNTDFIAANESSSKNAQDDYVAFEDEQPTLMRVGSRENISQPQETPGEMGSSIPGIEAFQDPAHDPHLASIFQNISFEYNSSMVKGEKNLLNIQRIADWMKSHPNAYVFIEGHCDSRGPSAYNFALGANRANAARNLLIKEGISQDRVFTISYGKERPLLEGDTEEVFGINRRDQFKVYQK